MAETKTRSRPHMADDRSRGRRPRRRPRKLGPARWEWAAAAVAVAAVAGLVLRRPHAERGLDLRRRRHGDQQPVRAGPDTLGRSLAPGLLGQGRAHGPQVAQVLPPRNLCDPPPQLQRRREATPRQDHHGRGLVRIPRGERPLHVLVSLLCLPAVYLALGGADDEQCDGCATQAEEEDEEEEDEDEEEEEEEEEDNAKSSRTRKGEKTGADGDSGSGEAKAAKGIMEEEKQEEKQRRGLRRRRGVTMRRRQ